MSLVGDCCGENGLVYCYLDVSPNLDSINKTEFCNLSGAFINLSVRYLINNVVNLKD